MNVAIITDSFPPMIDGVSRCALGYADALHKGSYGNCIVITPRVPNVEYSYPFRFYGLTSFKLPYAEYRAGHPFTPKLIRELKAMNIDIIHAHSPFISMTIARQLRYFLNIPIVFTQHTKWEFDISRAISIKVLQKKIERYAYKNLSSANELWAVSHGAGKYLVNCGYKGSYIVMPNGTDFSQEDADPIFLSQINTQFDLLDNVPILLFVGRMMWYKNLKLIIEALDILHRRQFGFHMIFVGDGEDLPDVQGMVKSKNLADIIHFAGRVSDREMLRAYYARSDLLVFPSLYDNAPLVVQEAASCSCPSLVVCGSSASEILEDNVTGFFTNDNAESIANSIQKIFSNHEQLKKVSSAASEQIYLPWDKAIKHSVQRYEVVIKSYNAK